MKIYINTPLNNARRKIAMLKELTLNLEKRGADITAMKINTQDANEKEICIDRINICAKEKEANRENLLAAYEEYFIAAEKELNK